MTSPLYLLHLYLWQWWNVCFATLIFSCFEHFNDSEFSGLIWTERCQHGYTMWPVKSIHWVTTVLMLFILFNEWVYSRRVFGWLDERDGETGSSFVRWHMILTKLNLSTICKKRNPFKLWLTAAELGQIVLHMWKRYTLCRQLPAPPEAICCCQVAPNQKLPDTPEHN